MPTTKAHIKATGKYEAKAYDKVLLRLRKDGFINRDKIANIAKNNGKSLNGYILEAINEKIERENEVKN